MGSIVVGLGFLDALALTPNGQVGFLAKSGTRPTLSNNLKIAAEEIFSGGLVKNNKVDEAADALSKKIGGESRVSFANDPLKREFDVISDMFIGQTKSTTQLGSSFRSQAKATFEAAKANNKSVYYEFTGGTPSKEVLDKLTEYSKRYGVELKIDFVN